MTKSELLKAVVIPYQVRSYQTQMYFLSPKILGCRNPLSSQVISNYLEQAGRNPLSSQVISNAAHLESSLEAGRS